MNLLYGPMLTGILPVLPVPFAEDGGVSFPDFEAVVRFTVDAGAHGLVFPGTASEAAFLKTDERRSLADLLVGTVAGRIPLVIGASGKTVDEVRANIDLAERVGAAALMLVPGPAFGTRVPEIARALSELDTAGIPILLQNVPAPVGTDLDIDQVCALIEEVPAIEYVKEEGFPSGQHITRTLQAAGGRLKGVFGGGGARYIVDELVRGSCGAMPAAELTDVHVMLYEAFKCGDNERARRLYDLTMPLLMMQAVFRTGLTKHVLKQRGIISNTNMRAGFPPMDDIDVAESAYWVRLLEDRLAAFRAEAVVA